MSSQLGTKISPFILIVGLVVLGGGVLAWASARAPAVQQPELAALTTLGEESGPAIDRQTLEEINKVVSDQLTFIYGSARRWNLLGRLMAWGSFLLMSVISIAMGARGQLVSPNEQLTSETLNKAAGRDKRFRVATGILAALSVVFVGVGERAAAEAAETEKSARALEDTYYSAAKDLAGTDDPVAAKILVQQLRSAVERARL